MQYAFMCVNAWMCFLDTSKIGQMVTKYVLKRFVNSTAMPLSPLKPLDVDPNHSFSFKFIRAALMLGISK